MLYHEQPDWHEDVKPKHDNKEIELVGCQSEKEEFRQKRPCPGRKIAIDERIMQKIKRRPNKVRDEDGFKASGDKSFVVKFFLRIQTVEKAESRDEKEDRHAEPGKNFKNRDEVDVGKRVAQILRTGVDTDDAQHGYSADILDGGKPLFFYHQKDLLILNFMNPNFLIIKCVAGEVNVSKHK